MGTFHEERDFRNIENIIPNPEGKGTGMRGVIIDYGIPSTQPVFSAFKHLCILPEGSKEELELESFGGFKGRRRGGDLN